jgi:uncharacterized membrane protein YhhN
VHLIAPDKVGLSSGILDRFLDHILHFIPVAGINAVDDALEVLLDLATTRPICIALVVLVVLVVLALQSHLFPTEMSGKCFARSKSTSSASSTALIPATGTTKTTSTTNAMQIGLVVGCVGALTRRIFLGDVLKGRRFSPEREGG